MSRTVKALAIASTALPLAVEASTCHRESPAQTVALLELYASKGCRSCPPADRWLRELSQRFSAEQLIPHALHVDYRDCIGRKDCFADRRFIERQKQVSRFSGGGTIHAQEVFAGMKGLRAWRSETELAERIRRFVGTPAAASITLRMSSSGANAADVQAVSMPAPSRRRPL